MDQNPLFTSVRNYISYLVEKQFIVKKAFIFGSYATGRQNENSDIDLALVMDNLSNGYLMQIELMKLSRKFDSRIEPHPFDELDFDISNPFAKEVITKGIQVF